MNLVICKDKVTCGVEAAKFGAEKIRKAIAEQGECRIILATGASQFEMLSALLKEEGIDWSKVTMFHLDEISVDGEWKKDFGPLPATSVALLGAIVCVWIVLGTITALQRIKSRKVRK